MKRKLLSVLLTFCLAFSLLPTAALADDEPMVMDLDRPFLFVIRTEDVPLFVGIVNQVG